MLANEKGVKIVNQLLAANPELLNSTDAQGNTPLHYAVAQHNLASIKYWIQKGVDITAENHLGETAADWYQEYITSIRYISPINQIEEIKQEIEENNIQFVTDCLKLRVPRILRFSKGETLLHYAVEAQQKAIIELILEGLSHEAIERLLYLKDFRGVTPLALAQQHGQTGSLVAQEILNYLEKQLAATALQTPPSCSLFPLIRLEKQDIEALVDRFTDPIMSVDFESLNPRRSTMAKLAYNLCHQAHQHYLKLFSPTVSSKKQPPVIKALKALLEKLFGDWSDNTQLKFVKKLKSTMNYLAHLIQQRQVEQFIYFSDEEPTYSGWHDHENNKIFLNPTIKTNVPALLTTLIHEMTHLVDQSYDFFLPIYEISEEGFFIDVSKAARLAATGAADLLTPEYRKVFEIRQLLEEGFSEDSEKKLHRWMALNSAETLAQAILALATVPAGYAKLIGSKRQPMLWIPSEKFLSAYAGEITFDSPEAKSTKKRPCVDGYGSPESISTWTGSDEEKKKSESELASSSTLGEKVAGFTDTVSVVIANPSGTTADRPRGDTPFAVSGPTDCRLS